MKLTSCCHLSAEKLGFAISITIKGRIGLSKMKSVQLSITRKALVDFSIIHLPTGSLNDIEKSPQIGSIFKEHTAHA